MSVHSKAGVLTSVGIHGIFFGALAFAITFGSCSQPPIEHVFTLVSPPSPRPVVESVLPEPIEATEELPPTLAVPEIPSMPKVERLNIPDLTPPAPPPPPKAPPPPAKTPSTPPPAPQPKVEQAPAPKTISYEDFVAKEGQPKAPVRQTPAPARRQSPQLDTSRITSQLRRVAEATPAKNAPAPSARLQAEMESYEQALIREIDRLWNKPPELSGHDLDVLIQFAITADGQIVGISVSRSSGNDMFDRSAVAAVRAAQTQGAPPSRRHTTYTVPFRMIERR